MSSAQEGFRTVTPHLFVEGARDAIALYEKALGAQTLMALPFPGTDKIMHAVLQVGDSPVFVADANPEAQHGPTGPMHFYLYVESSDAAYAKAVEAGFTANSEPTDMFWGDRIASASDPYGISWTFAQRVREVSPEEMEKAMAELPS